MDLILDEPELTQTEDGSLPSDWQVKELDTIANVVDSLHRTPKFTDSGFSMVRVSDIKTGDLDLSNTLKVCESEFEAFTKNHRPARGNIVLSRVGSYGVNSYVETEEPFCMGQNTVVIEANVNSRYLYYFLNSPIVRQQIEDGSYGTGYKSLSLKNIRGLRIPIPAPAEQRAIAEALSDVDALINALDALITKKRHIKQGTMQQLLTGKKRLPGFSGEFETTTFEEVIDNFSSGSTPSRRRPDFYEGDIRWITSSELNYNVITDTTEKITSEAVEKTCLKTHEPETFLMAITGLEAAGTRGSCGIVGARATTNQSCMALSPGPRLTSRYLFHYYVQNGDFLALRYCQGTKQQSYTARIAKKLPITIPPTTKEQDAITSVLDDTDAEITALEQKRDKTKLIKQGMMQELLTGRTRLV